MPILMAEELHESWRGDEVFSKPQVAGERGEEDNEEIVMQQVQNDTDRFAGRFMIQDNDHMAEIPQQDGRRQSEQGQQDGGQQGGERRTKKKAFNYENPRQY